MSKDSKGHGSDSRGGAVKKALRGARVAAQKAGAKYPYNKAGVKAVRQLRSEKVDRKIEALHKQIAALHRSRI